MLAVEGSNALWRSAEPWEPANYSAILLPLPITRDMFVFSFFQKNRDSKILSVFFYGGGKNIWCTYFPRVKIPRRVQGKNIEGDRLKLE